MRAGDGYPGQQAFQPDDRAGQPPGPGGPGKKTWPVWWIVPYLGGAAVVLAVFALVQLTVLRHPAGHAAAASSSPAAQGPMPAQMFPDALFKKLTQDIQADNEKDFLSLVAPSAKPAVQTWLDNLQAIGFTTGLIMPTNKTDQVNLNTKGDGTAVVLAGTHNALDPLDSKRHPEVPLERYQIGLHFSSAKAIGQITAWKPLGDAPWDQGKLYVRKADNVAVAGPASESSVVDETLPIAQAAAAYDVGLINHVHPSDLRQSGFVVFVSDDPAVRNRWFSTTKQPSGWPTASSSGLTAQLPGPGTSANTNWSLGDLAKDTTGGARVVITPFEDQNSGTRQLETAELVHRFALDILAASDQDLFAGLAPPPSIPAWAIEGFGVAFEATYYSNTNPAPDEYSFKELNAVLKELPASYKNGDVPTADELYNGSDQTQQDWRVAAGSVYAYIATHYGMSQLLASAELMWTGQPDPRQNVLKSSTKTTYTFYGKDTIQSGWEAYMASPSDLAPLAGPAGA